MTTVSDRHLARNGSMGKAEPIWVELYKVYEDGCARAMVVFTLLVAELARQFRSAPGSSPCKCPVRHCKADRRAAVLSEYGCGDAQRAEAPVGTSTGLFGKRHSSPAGLA